MGRKWETAMPNKRPKILIVDDERAISSMLATILKSRNYETATAYSGEEAVQAATSFEPDCIVSDVMMGAMNGIEAVIEILGVLPNCKVLFMSGNAPSRDLLSLAIAKGYNFEIQLKPVPVDELLSRISQLVPHSADYTSSHCSHLHCEVPMTSKKPGSVSFEGKPSTTTYVVCLDCGKEFTCEMVASATGTRNSVA